MECSQPTRPLWAAAYLAPSLDAAPCRFLSVITHGAAYPARSRSPSIHPPCPWLVLPQVGSSGAVPQGSVPNSGVDQQRHEADRVKPLASYLMFRHCASSLVPDARGLNKSLGKRCVVEASKNLVCNKFPSLPVSAMPVVGDETHLRTAIAAPCLSSSHPPVRFLQHPCVLDREQKSPLSDLSG